MHMQHTCIGNTVYHVLKSNRQAVNNKYKWNQVQSYLSNLYEPSTLYAVHKM